MGLEDVPNWALKLIEDVGKLNGTTDQILTQTQKTNGRVTSLESRVNILESQSDTSAGARAAKKSFWDHFWEVGKIIIAAGIGAAAGRWGK